MTAQQQGLSIFGQVLDDKAVRAGAFLKCSRHLWMISFQLTREASSQQVRFFGRHNSSQGTDK